MRHLYARVARLAGACVLVLAMTGCAGGGDPPAASQGTQVTGTITVFAAASLTDVFGDIAAGFESANPAAHVELNFASSSGLASQINEGAPADVFASASPPTMKTVSDAGNAVGDAVVFTRNQLVIAVEKGNPKAIGSLADLADPDVLVALCAPQVPCGAAAEKALESASLTVTPVTYESDVRAALSKVALGEVDAALVYRTDALIESGVAAIEFPESANAMNDYPIAVLAQAPNPAGARAFVDYVLSTAGAAKLTDYGFQQP